MLALAAVLLALGWAQAPGARASQFDGRGMWIWYVDKSGGSARNIAAKAKKYNLHTVFIKSGDAGNTWSQFNRTLTGGLKARGIHVCAWQFVYGSSPRAEANVGAAAKKRGAQCLVIDAEASYEHNKYAAADTYIRRLRAQIGGSFPLALAGFPYVDYHPSFPYSVFLGPGGARANIPQMYWKAIGVSVHTVYAHTYLWNRVFGRAIFPLGQTYQNPGSSQIRSFRRYALDFGANGVSWWSWQETSRSEWQAIAPRVSDYPNYRAPHSFAHLRRGNRGDVVVWAQMHLDHRYSWVTVDGVFGSTTERAVKRFQNAEHLQVTGTINNPTWRHLLKVSPTRKHWASVSSAGASGARTPAAARAPATASMPAVRYEIPPPAQRMQP